MKYCERCDGPKMFYRNTVVYPTPGCPGVRNFNKRATYGWSAWHCPSCSTKFWYNNFGQGEEESDPPKLMKDDTYPPYCSHIYKFEKQALQLDNGYKGERTG